MRVGLEVRALHRSYRGSGQSRYAYNLLRELAGQDRENEYQLFAPYPRDELDFPPLAATFRYSYTSLPVPRESARQWLWEQLVFPVFLRERGVAVCHFLLQMAARWAPCKLVVTAYDTMYELFPEYAHIRRSRSYRWHKRALQKADRLLAISRNTRDDLIKHYRIEGDKIAIVPLAADPVFRPWDATAELEEVKSKYGLTERFILSVLSYEPRKNTLGVIKAFAEFVRWTGLQHHLVLFGDRGWGVASDSIERAIAETGMAEAVRVVGRLTDGELAAFYNLAEFFVFPSLYEGFGLPVLEALACGTAVVAGKASSMPEVLGDAGLCVDVTRVGEMAEAMARLASDTDLRHLMERRALAQARC